VSRVVRVWVFNVEQLEIQRLPAILDRPNRMATVPQSSPRTTQSELYWISPGMRIKLCRFFARIECDILNPGFMGSGAARIVWGCSILTALTASRPFATTLSRIL
jgi:hypothetical protein